MIKFITQNPWLTALSAFLLGVAIDAILTAVFAKKDKCEQCDALQAYTGACCSLDRNDRTNQHPVGK